VISESEKYAAFDFGEAKPKGSVYIIIEFIFKKSATEFYQIIEPLEHGFDEIFVLSGTILEHRRKRIINFLKRKENRKKRILLITTQVVEAGVDIDMDIGFKNVSIIDSDEQLAGRINRNMNKQQCQLFLFKLNEPSVIYQKDYRFEKTRKHLSADDHLQILQNKDFDKLYDLVLDGIKEWNDTEFAAGKLIHYLEDIKRLNFQSVSENFKLIDQQTLSVFVPLDIPVEIDGKDEVKPDEVFSKSELKLLRERGIAIDETVNGSAVFELYLAQLEQKMGDFVHRQIDLKTLQSILSKFVFSVFGTEKVRARFMPFSDVQKSEFGYLYLSGWNKLYSEIFGLDESKFDHIDHQFL
jgi:CRISPR-associated endonuclease/helicase Cas3